MTTWVTRIGRALMMGVAWAAAWIPIAILLAVIVDPDDSMDEPWFAAGAYAGFLCGTVFSAVAGIAAGRRRLGELSFSRAAAWGAVAGLLIGVLPFVLGSQNAGEHPLWVLPVVLIGTMTLMSATSAVVSALLARTAKRGQLRDADATSGR